MSPQKQPYGGGCPRRSGWQLLQCASIADGWDICAEKFPDFVIVKATRKLASQESHVPVCSPIRRQNHSRSQPFKLSSIIENVENKSNIKPSKILLTVFFPILVVLSFGFVLFLKQFSQSNKGK
jgi:hypothetical protein